MESSSPISQSTCWQRLAKCSDSELEDNFCCNSNLLLQNLHQELVSSKSREATLALVCRIIAYISPMASSQNIKDFFTILTIRNIWPDSNVNYRPLIPDEEKMILIAIETVCRKSQSSQLSLLPELVERTAHMTFKFYVQDGHKVSLALMQAAATYSEAAVIRYISAYTHFTEEEEYRIAKLYLKSVHRNENTQPLSKAIFNFSRLTSPKKDKLAEKACKIEPQALQQNIHMFCLSQHKRTEIEQELLKGQGKKV